MSALRAITGNPVNYYHRHLGDYAKDTTLLTMLQHGAYNLLIDRYYVSECGIPADEAYAVAKAFSKEEKKAADFVLKKFFRLKAGLWIKDRCEEEIAKAKERIHAARNNGRKGGRPCNPEETQWDTQKKPSGIPEGLAKQNPDESSPISNLQSPISNPPEKRTTAASRPDSESFEALKMLYPRRAGGNPWPRALKACRARISEGHTWEEILSGAGRYSAYVRATGKERTEYVLQAATFCGPDKRFLESWDPPATKAEIHQDANIQAGRDWLEAADAPF